MSLLKAITVQSKIIRAITRSIKFNHQVLLFTLILVSISKSWAESEVPLTREFKASTEFHLPPKEPLLTEDEMNRVNSRTSKVEIVPNEYTPGFLKYFHVEIKTAQGLSSYERDILDLTQTYFGLTIGDKVDQAVDDYEKYAGDRKFVVGLSIRTSLAPVLLEDSTKREVHKVITEKVRDGAVAAAAINVRDAMEKNVHPAVLAGHMTEQDYQATLAHNILSTQNAVAHNEPLINNLARPYLHQADEHIETAAQEIILQELAVKFAWSPMPDHSLLVFGGGGKAMVNGNMKEGLRQYTTFGGWANIANSTQGTGMVHLGVQTAVRNDIKVTFEAWLFHNRDPIRSGRSFLFNVVAMPEDVFHDQQDVTRIDSNMQRITVEHPSSLAEVQDSIYVSTADYNGERAYGGGAIVRIVPKISVQVEGSVGRDSLLQSAVMEALLYHHDDNLTLFLANENVRGLHSAYHLVDPTVSLGELGAVSIGGRYAWNKINLGYGFQAAINSTLGFRCFYQQKGLEDQDKCGVDAGLSGQVNWN